MDKYNFQDWEKALNARLTRMTTDAPRERFGFQFGDITFLRKSATFWMGDLTQAIIEISSQGQSGPSSVSDIYVAHDLGDGQNISVQKNGTIYGESFIPEMTFQDVCVRLDEFESNELKWRILRAFWLLGIMRDQIEANYPTAHERIEWKIGELCEATP